MIHSILFVVSKPADTNFELDNKWHKCVSALSDQASNNEGILLLAENCLLLPLNLSVLSQIVQAAAGFQYKYAIFDENIEWLEG